MAVKAKAEIIPVMTSLTDRHVRVLRLRYGFDSSVGHTLAEVGEQLGLSRQHVSWIEHEALRKIQKNPSILDETDCTAAQKAILLSGERPPRLHLAQGSNRPTNQVGGVLHGAPLYTLG